MPNGYVLWEGPSQLDGQTPIICVLTPHSRNAKTGDAAQTWILARDTAPMDAVRSGADHAVCGNCVHRQLRTCYVEVWQAPANVWKAYHQGNYPAADSTTLRRILRNRVLRIGAYGDPAAVPLAVWDEVVPFARKALGYTHQWRRDVRLARYCMASVDNLAEREEAKALGFRTFRTRGADSPRLQHQEAACPAAKESGKLIQCVDCCYCDVRSGGGDVSIVVHGARARKYIQGGIPIELAGGSEPQLEEIPRRQGA